MLEAALIALAQFAGQTVAAAAITGVWESARHKVARLLGRGDPKMTEVAERWLADTHGQLAAAADGDLEPARAAQAQRWEGRFADLLDEDPGIEAELRAVVEEIAAQLPAGVVAAADHSLAAGRDVNITAPGPSGAFGPGSAVASHLGTAIGQVVQPPRPEVAALPVSLPPRPVLLAGREELLAGLDAQLSGGDGPRVVALHGLGGAGKTSVALEYAHRHLAEAGLAWQLPAEDPALLLAGFARLAAQLGAREVIDARDPVASVHGVLAAYTAAWLLVFDNAPDRAAVEAFLPPAGRGRVLITSQSAAWPPGQAVLVPVLDTEVAAGFLVNRTGEPDR